MIHLLGTAEPLEHQFLRGFVLGPRSERTHTAANGVLDMMHQHGSLLFADIVSKRLADECRALFPAAMGGSSLSAPTQFLYELIEYSISRTM
jgi:geranylgeranyl diphosphate synthase type II